MTTSQQDNTKKIDFINCIEHITSLVSAQAPYIWINTHEEARFVLSLYKEIAYPNKRELFTWSSWQGVVKFDPSAPSSFQQSVGEWDKTFDPPSALKKIAAYQQSSSCKGAIFVLKDFHVVLAGPIPRQLRDMYQHLIDNSKTIIITAPFLAHGPSGSKAGIEPTLDKQITVVDYELPSFDYIHDRVVKTVATVKKQNADREIKTQLDYSEEEYRTFASALQGLTEIEVDNALFTCITHLGKIDAKRLLLEKKQIIKKSEILEYVGLCPGLADVGGLDEAKRYFDMYRDQFSPEARNFGVEPLRGVLLTGIPGAGKSLLAKAISSQWNLPLLRLDVGRVMGSLVGSSEQRMRDVISQAESIAPCVLWIDEIEKSLSGTKSSNMSDGGTLSRVFGTLLTAMEERLEGIVVIATANDISALPPELIRRFNEVLFVDLPMPPERAEIYMIHFRKRGRDISKLDIDMEKIVAATNQYTGSEIEKIVKEAITRAWHDNKAEVNTSHILAAIKDTRPISTIMGDKISQIRDWARNRARYASSLAAAASSSGNQKVTTKSGKELDLKGELDNLDEIVTTGKEKKNKTNEELQDTTIRSINLDE